MLALFLSALATEVSADGHLPFAWPAGMPEPVAYYWLDEGSGEKLKESVSGDVEAGYVYHEVEDQPDGVYPGVTWRIDPHFGNVFQCGNEDTMAKDVLQFADVDYGVNGPFTINLWVRNPIGSDFPSRQKEQLFGHGDANEMTSSPNQIHIQLENLHLGSSNGPGGEILTIIADGNDFPSCVKEGELTGTQSEGHATNPDREAVEALTGVDVFPVTTCSNLMAELNAEGKVEGATLDDDCIYNTTLSNTTPIQCNRISRAASYKTTFFADDGTIIQGTIGITQDSWHMITLTTNSTGSKGFITFLDGVARGSTPYAGFGQNNNEADEPQNGGDPIDPVGPIRLCGREKPGDWTGESGRKFDDRRYANVELAHFSVYSGAMTAAQVEELRQAYLSTFFPKSKEGYADRPGACRGPGGENDKVNSKYKQGVTLEDCTEECNNNAAACKGFAYNPDANDGECLIYGPGFAGACSDTSADSPSACEALGTCSDADKTSEESCGSCSSSSGTTKATCEGIGQVWTPATWTSAGATWIGPSDGWIADFHAMNFVVHSEGNPYGSTDYTCYDVDVFDHHAKCEGFVDVAGFNCAESDVDTAPGCTSTSDYLCAAGDGGPGTDGAATCGSSSCGGDCNGCSLGCAYCSQACYNPTGHCPHVFVEMTKDEKVADECPAGCTFVPAVTSARVVVVHAPAEIYDGWTVNAGVCRADGGAKPNGRYTNSAGADGGPPTQSECKDFCAAAENCIGYAHSTAWCLNYGPDMNTTDEVWTGDNHPATTITEYKVNPAYICGEKDVTHCIWSADGCPTTAAPTTAAPTTAKAATPEEDTTAKPTSAAPTTTTTTTTTLVDESICRRGAMVALLVWLTGFLQ
jgi:hypothetical protein